MAFGRLDSRLNSLSKSSRAQNAAPARKRIPRSEERRPTYKIGKVRTSQSEIQCVVLDMSLSGAQVKLEGAIMLAPEVTLVIPDLGYKKKCEVRWQDGDCVGLRIVSASSVR